MRFLSCLLLFALFLSCSADAPSGAANETSGPAPGVTPQPTVETNGEITPAPFSNLPELDGNCDCTLRLDGHDGDDELFFIFSKKGGAGVIGLNGQQISVERSASLQAAGGAIDTYLHENEQFIVHTKLRREGKDGEDGSVYSGSVEAIDKESGARLKAVVLGSCSC